jgi:hypothetical protein
MRNVMGAALGGASAGGAALGGAAKRADFRSAALGGALARGAALGGASAMRMDPLSSLLKGMRALFSAIYSGIRAPNRFLSAAPGKKASYLFMERGVKFFAM